MRFDGHVQRRAKIKCDVRNRREAVEISQPARGTIARHVARKRRVNVTVRQHQVSAVQQRQDLPLAAVRKIGGMQQRKCRRRQQPALLSAPRGRFHQRRRIPFREMQPVAADFQPPLQQVQLRAFPGAVDPFDDDQRSRVPSRAAPEAANRLPGSLRWLRSKWGQSHGTVSSSHVVLLPERLYAQIVKIWLQDREAAHEHARRSSCKTLFPKANSFREHIRSDLHWRGAHGPGLRHRSQARRACARW